MRLDINQIQKQLGYRIHNCTSRPDSDVYGPDLSVMDFRDVWVIFNRISGEVLEITAHFDVMDERHAAFWITDKHQIKMRAAERYEITHCSSQVYSLTSMLKIMEACEAGAQFDLGLLLDIEFDLPPGMVEKLQDMATTAGLPPNALLAELIHAHLLALKDADS